MSTLKVLPDIIGMAVLAVVVALLLTLGIGPWNVTEMYAPNNTQANQWHGNIGTVGGGAGGGSNANPNDNTDGIHGIANNPGQSGVAPADQANGNPSCNMHGGFNGVKKQCGG